MSTTNFLKKYAFVILIIFACAMLSLFLTAMIHVPPVINLIVLLLIGFGIKIHDDIAANKKDGTD